VARSHGRILSAIWTDTEFTALPCGPQRLYLFLLSQSDLSHAGLLPLRARRWAAKVGGATADSIEADLDVLAGARFVVIDRDTEEVLIRTFVRNDGVYKQPRVMQRMREDAQQIESPALRGAFLAELDRLPLDELSDQPGGPRGDQPSVREIVAGVVATLREDFRGGPVEAPAGVSDTPADGYRGPSRVRAGALPHPPTPIPQPPAPVPPTAAQALVAEWIDHCPGGRPPGRVVGQVSREIGLMLTEGLPVDDVRRGLAEWHRKGLHPSALASVVHEVRTAPARGSTADERVASVQALKDAP